MHLRVQRKTRWLLYSRLSWATSGHTYSPTGTHIQACMHACDTHTHTHTHTHSSGNEQSYLHAVKLLSSLSGFQVSRKAWRKEALDLFLSPSFFQMGPHPLREWRVVVDNLMTQDNLTFRDLLSRVHPSNTSGVVNIFISIEQVAPQSKFVYIATCICCV